MSTLGLSGEPIQKNNRFKSLLWPEIHTASDIDTLHAQGFWICQFIAFMSAIFLILTSHFVLASIVFGFFFLGSMGVREGSLSAIAVVFSAYFLDGLAILRIFNFFSIVRLIVIALLLANWRGTILAQRWKKRQTPESLILPARFSENWRDRYCDQLPRIAWPRVKYIFYLLAFIVIFAELITILLIYFH